jgi:uncharacterized integral membrane protein
MNKASTSNQTNSTDLISHAQSDMNEGYANGAVGMLVSGLMWLISAIVSIQFSDQKAVFTLLIGGMFIHPLGVLLCKIMRLSGTHTKGNPLGKLAMEGTIFMLMCMPLAVGLSLQHTEWFFQGMLMIIGGRYLTFASIYGDKLYWVLGATLGVAACLLFSLKVQSFGSAITGSLIEIIFGFFVLITFRKKNKSLNTL